MEIEITIIMDYVDELGGGVQIEVVTPNSRESQFHSFLAGDSIKIKLETEETITINKESR